jgi:hypothetical protein
MQHNGKGRAVAGQMAVTFTASILELQHVILSVFVLKIRLCDHQNSPNRLYFPIRLFLGVWPVFFPVTLDYRIDFYNQGSNHNFFASKTIKAVMNLVISNFAILLSWLPPHYCAGCRFFSQTIIFKKYL